MATMLYLNPAGELIEVNQQQSILSFTQTSSPGLDDIDPSASNGQQTRSGGGMFIWMILLMLVVMMIFARPRQDKEGEKFRNALQLDQDVVTSTGIFGKIKAVDEISVVLEIGQNMRIKVDKRYVNPVPVPQPVKPAKEKKEKKSKDPSKDEKA